MAKKSFTYKGKRYWVERKNPDELPYAVAQKKLALEQEYIKESKIVFKDYSSRWLNTYKTPYVSKDTISMYKVTINCINSYMGTLNMKDVSPDDIQSVITEEYKLGRSKSRIDKLILTFRQIFRQAVIDGTIKRDPSVSIRRPKMKEERSRALTEYEYKMIEKTCEHSKYGLWVLTMLYLGLRPKETELLRWDDFDFSNRLVHIRGTKTDKADRYIPLNDRLVSLYRRFYSDGYVFHSKDSLVLRKQTRDRWWKYFVRELDIEMGAKLYRNKIIESKVAPDLSPYMLRHTFATRMATKIDVNALAQIMGHSNIQVTYQYYLHYDEENMEKIRNAMS